MLKGNVMIVEDQYHFRKGLVKMIESSHHNWNVVSEASNGQDALKMLEAHQPNLILTDIRMPVMDGIEFVTKVREKYPKTQIIILSGYRDFEYARSAIKLGVIDYLVKPCTVDDINNMLDKVTDFFNSMAQTESLELAPSNKDHEDKGISSEEKQKRIINKAMTYIELHYADDCRLTEVASHVKLNPSYFSVLFKKMTGSSYSHYLINFRLEKALQLLITTDMKVMEIAAAVGFEGSNYFTNVFRQVYAISPKEYRNQYRENLKLKEGGGL